MSISGHYILGEKRKTRVGDGCSKWRKSRGRNKGADVGVSLADRAVFAGQEKFSLCANFREKGVNSPEILLEWFDRSF